MAATRISLTHFAGVRMILLALMLGVALIPTAQAKGPADFCLKHPRHDTYHLIKAGGRSMESLMEFPGGAPVGDLIPTDSTHVFGPDCEPIPITGPPDDPAPTTTTTAPSPSTSSTTSTTTTTTTTVPPAPQVIARAWSVNRSGDSVLIAQLTDMDSSGTPTAGDVVATAYFPLRTDGSSFGTFGTTNHTIGGGFVGTASDGATVLAVWAPCGVRECHFEWSVYDDGTTRWERYSEFVVLSDDGATARTGFYDTTDGTRQDIVSVNPSSPSDPNALTYDGITSATDDPFLQVSIG